MFHKKSGLFVLLVSSILMCAGCGANQIQDLTEEQLEQVGNYSAGIILKYDANSRSRLVSDEEIQKYDERQRRLEEIRKREEEKRKQQEEEGTVNNPTNSDVPTGDTIPVKYDDLTDFYVLPEGVSLVYTGFTVQDAYPDDGSNSYPITPSDGKALLVLNFRLTNSTDQDVPLDFFGYKASYKITVNNQYTKGIFTTILLDDLATYIGNLKAGSSEKVVLLTEMDRSNLQSVQSVVLKIKDVSNEYTIKLN